MTFEGLECRGFKEAGLGAVADLLATSKCKLIKADFAATDRMLIADLTKADFSGYGDADITAFGDPGFDPDGVPYVTSGVLSFVASGSSITNLVYGLWVDHGSTPTVPDLLCRFDTPLSFDEADDAFNCIIKIRGDGVVKVIDLDEDA